MTTTWGRAQSVLCRRWPQPWTSLCHLCRSGTVCSSAGGTAMADSRECLVQARLFEPAQDIVFFDLVLVMDKFTAADALKEVGGEQQGLPLCWQA